MFGNLIESRSHTNEFARRGYFIVGTTLCYGLMVVAGAVASVYAYDAKLETQDLEVVSMITPTTPIEIIQQPQNKPQTAKSHDASENIRTQLIAKISQNTNPPAEIATKPGPVPEIPDGNVRLGNINTNHDPVDGIPGPPTGPVGGTTVVENHPVIVEDTTPPPVKEVRKPITVSKGPVNGQAISLPKPVYPRLAMDTHITGAVKVQVLIDESGKVVSASVLEGHPLLRQAAVQAAWQAKFNPTTLGGTPVKVSGYITYNFMRQ